MRVCFSKPNLFYIEGKPSKVERLRLRRAGFKRFDGVWQTREFKRAALLRDCFNKPLKNLIDKVSVTHTPWTGRAPVPKDKKLKPIQNRAARFALSRNHSYLNLDMGIGKTPTAWAVINEFLNNGSTPRRCTDGWVVFPVLIIVPPFLLTNWLREKAAWQTRDYAYGVLRRGLIDLDEKQEIVFVPDSMLANDAIREIIMERQWSWVFMDEAQRYLNEDSKRTKAVYGEAVGGGIVHRAPRVTLLSGTAMEKGPIQLYPLLKALAWNEIDYRSRLEFGVDFCNGFEERIYHDKTAWNFKGESNLGVLRDWLDADFVMRAKLEDHAPELKGKLVEQVVVLDGGETKSIRKLEKVLLGTRSFKEFMQAHGERTDIGALSAYLKELSKIKVPIGCEFILDQLENSDAQFLVFASHVDAVKRVTEILNKKKIKTKAIYGAVKMKARDEIEKEFQSGKLRGIVANIKTMVGLNLTNAEDVFFLEDDWNSTANDQARSRAYRIGQKKIVRGYHLVLANTLDEYKLQTVIKKRRTINKLF